jgi:hypothetical protein
MNPVETALVIPVGLPATSPSTPVVAMPVVFSVWRLLARG